ncbi:PTS sugar transporter subunit IIA [Clostridium sp. YIM B02515]|uniref:PTS sugar transporter subunit IIA n=1 Tax=Clostridium rhizosphaerae TaxID=2803861 RepID=A0ABS1TBG0_9CLOT|nr:PTS sugar transporter subunit IIA [Clostridium rhizosphaerae]ERI95440.1 phosphoenolpyruvate-dependent sugar phosphotransferase system, EIIA 2 [Clostridiales bacterium oral taxon 876 str. F0540]MBL4935644.1 PTS sugar transporter subunit IIA [Clostridium rhizosphaerae]
MLKELLNEDTIEANVEVENWEQAVIYGGMILEKCGAAQSSYTNAMVDTVKNIGPYIVIAPGVAMPHARPEAGVNKVGMSLITLKKPVAFGNDEYDPVNIVISLCAFDNDSHLNILSNLMNLIEDEKFIELAKKAESKDELVNYINNIA